MPRVRGSAGPWLGKFDGTIGLPSFYPWNGISGLVGKAGSRRMYVIGCIVLIACEKCVREYISERNYDTYPRNVFPKVVESRGRILLRLRGSVYEASVCFFAFTG